MQTTECSHLIITYYIFKLCDYKLKKKVGWKRPASTATVMIKKMIDNKQSKKPDDEVKRKSLDKEIYLEAVYKYKQYIFIY